MVKSPLEILYANAELLAKAQQLALESRDESKTPVERVLALAELGQIMERLEFEQLRLQAVEYFGSAENQEPKFKWVNGARVKV